MNIESLAAGFADPSPPPAIIPPRNTSVPLDDRAFTFGGSTVCLASEQFQLLLFDTPRAVLFETKATYLSADERFCYCYQSWFDHEWALAKEPVGHFANHAVWSRQRGTLEWRLRASDAIMANLVVRNH